MTDKTGMRKLLDLAADKSDQAEVFHYRSDYGSLSVRNGRVTDMSAGIQTGYALRIIKNGKLGTAYTKNLLDPRKVAENAGISMKGHVEAGFSFPSPCDLPPPPSMDGTVASMGFDDLYSYSDKAYEYLSDRVEGQVDIAAERSVTDVSIMNSNGLDVTRHSPVMYLFASVLFPNTETAVRKIYRSSSASEFPGEDLEEMAELYRAGLPEVEVHGGRMQVMFTQDTMFTLLWRLSAGASGMAFHSGISPLLKKRGKKVLSEKFTLYDDPTDTSRPEASFFDDEGVKTRKHVVFRNGIFENLILNLDYAARLGEEPTGNGYRESMWGGETVAIQPAPLLKTPGIAPGKASFRDMVSGMDRGVIVMGVLGAHSGNINNGDFSVGLNPGYYVENGKIKGRIKDGMVAGNVYEVLRNVVAVEDELHDSLTGGRFPAILLEDVSVSAR